MKSFVWNGLTLLPQRAVWRADTRALFVADVHLGKAAAFRAVGLPVPAGTTRENLARLDDLIEALQPRRLVVLGDLFHARAAYREATLKEVLAWRSKRAGLAVTLVAGNHDARAGAPPAALGLELVDEPFALDGLTLRHLPLDDDAKSQDSQSPPTLAGHLHPAARLSGPAHDSLRLPCFVLRGRQVILPAFGEFTGGSLATADAVTALCLVAGDRFVHIPAGTVRRARARR
jgi:DNA ligase-associated metallophosphoesterase